MRYQPHTNKSRQAMLQTIGVDNIQQLFQDVPKGAFASKLDLPNHQTELAVDNYFQKLAARNLSPAENSCFLGGGSYYHHIPASVDHLIQRGEFLTSYTPYQPEISQGTLQYLFEFQTQVASLLGMDVTNASMYDGATAAAEAVMMAKRITKRNKCLISARIHPHYRETIDTYSRFADFTIAEPNPKAAITDSENIIDYIDNQISCVIVQYPDFFGNLVDFTELASKCQEVGVLLITVTTEIVSLGLIKSPGAMGADIAVAEGQSIGNTPNFGGPTVGLFATKDKYLRQLPGRIVGETNDTDGKRGWVLTLSTREQHIRREKATSNICTNSGLCALAFTIHMSLLGGTGLNQLAKLNHMRARKLHKVLSGLNGVKIIPTTYFNEFLVKLPIPSSTVVEAMAKAGILAGIPLTRFKNLQQYPNHMLVCATEMVSDFDIEKYADELAKVIK